MQRLFLSTLSLRRATPPDQAKVALNNLFLSTLSLRRATAVGLAPLHRFFQFLSTLSLRRATSSPRIKTGTEPISIHALLAESDRRSLQTVQVNLPFLSTLSLRRATAISGSTARVIYISIHALLAESDASLSVISSSYINFYPRSPCGERRRLWRASY